ncbi:type II toxin-antitoxin system Phd/YefM family antitoxin [Synechococcus sp. CBW1004]|jgi:prevent-host-death family protein|uniref:type II toxin-antitoxin system Phd/YefM family antitoxin n=1 Tax=Synechococcus sp. CBW1004 TaxID=1353136 RepID=UPI0018CF49FB|nr:type II toxin-antitoxin system prevent-host-death family antitoxin [Synechococcus sp. CBW1004]QPN62727.1 type II toxin-antitoxin system prevent-host-death family antitoxin [Synechococcus sp. CBW1004]
MHPPSTRAPASLTTAAVPLAEAKNQLSALIARVEQGEEIAITRRGLPVARLVPDPQRQDDREERARMVTQAIGRLRTLRADLTLDGDLRAIAREGLD